MKDSLLIVGSVAYDCIETPLDSADFILRVSDVQAAYAALDFLRGNACRNVSSDFELTNRQRRDILKAVACTGVSRI